MSLLADEDAVLLDQLLERILLHLAQALLDLPHHLRQSGDSLALCICRRHSSRSGRNLLSDVELVGPAEPLKAFEIVNALAEVDCTLCVVPFRVEAIMPGAAHLLSYSHSVLHDVAAAGLACRTGSWGIIHHKAVRNRIRAVSAERH